jgi:phosphatidylserine synthase
MKVEADNIVNFSTAALIWLFGVLVFLPLAEGINSGGLPILISLVVFVAFTVFLVKGLKNFSDLLDTVSDIIVKELVHRKKIDRTKKTRRRINIALKVASLTIIYLLYSPMLLRIHPSINGIGIIVTLLGIVVVLLKRTS